MTHIVESSYTEGAPQADGRTWVRERHVDSAGGAYEFDWLRGEQDVGAVLQARAATLNQQLAARDAAEALVAGTLLPLTKLQFRELFTPAERMAADALHATFETSEQLTDQQKAQIRTGLEDYRMAQNIRRPFDDRIQAMLALYVAMGVLTSARATEIVEAGNA
ncbi:hypothetical protein [Rubrivivax sp. JA1026]|uniref:hypothetical protein n=1 Tax=Rubrivivax sp. JA1026 TaxID=2710888 RepID=UPI0013E93F95|nr:hypothetical protein [Rubrivivax sp. JA1026]